MQKELCEAKMATTRFKNALQGNIRVRAFVPPTAPQTVQSAFRSISRQQSQSVPAKNTLAKPTTTQTTGTTLVISGSGSDSGGGGGAIYVDPYADSIIVGITALSLDPVNPVFPIAVGLNDQRVQVFQPAGVGASYGIVPAPPSASQNPAWYLGSDAEWHPPTTGGSGTTPTQVLTKFGTADIPNVSSVPVISVPGMPSPQPPAIDGSTFIYYLTIQPQSGFRLFADGAACVIVDVLQRAGDFLYNAMTGQITLQVAPINHIFADIQ